MTLLLRFILITLRCHRRGTFLASNFDEITCDCFIRLSTISTGPFFYSSLDTLPPGYQAIARHIEECAAECLASPRSKFVFRMFFVGHGHVHAKTRKDLMPIFSTTTTRGMEEINSVRSATVIDRFPRLRLCEVSDEQRLQGVSVA